MGVCKFCSDNIFLQPYLNSEGKDHHKDAAAWQKSASECLICSSLHDTVKEAVTECGLTPMDNVFQLFANVLPIYRVFLSEGGRRDQFLLEFQPTKANFLELHLDGSSKDIKTAVLPAFKFQVCSLDYDKAEIPELSESTNLKSLERDEQEARSLTQVRTWLQQCNHQHAHCKIFSGEQIGEAFVPTRLIEVGRPGESYVRLRKTDSSGVYRRYATLSHCWGYPPPTIQCKSYNIEEYKKAISLEAPFPKNFLDAITVCRLLNIKYIWIDSICIIQDSGQDQSIEIPSMHKVYGNSYLNIAAAASKDSTGGLFRQRQPTLLSPSLVKCKWQNRLQSCKIIREDFWSGELLGESLYRRAWVTQERMLSPRTLNFGTKQLFWQCLTIAACETMPDGVSSIVQSYSDRGTRELEWRLLLQKSRQDAAQKELLGEEGGELTQDDKVNLQEVWHDALRNYTSCNITSTTDKLPAVAGLAQVMSISCSESYVAGLWNEGDQLVMQLAWFVKDCKHIEGRSSQRQNVRENNGYRAPTWSWPSVVNGVIEIPRRIRVFANTKICLDLPTIKPHLIYKDPENAAAEFLQLAGGWLEARGNVYTVPFYDANDPTSPCWYWDLDVPDEEQPWLYLLPDQPFSNMDLSNEGLSKHGHKTYEFLILPLYYTEDETDYYSGRGLVVKEEKEAQKWYKVPKELTKPAFTRIGMVEFRKVHVSLWERFSERMYGLQNCGGAANEKMDMILL